MGLAMFDLRPREPEVTIHCPERARTEAKLKVLIRHLVLTFPHAGILSRQVGHAYHVCIIAPYDGSPEKTIQVERALLAESARSIKEFECFLAQLNLPGLFQTCERYELRSVSTPRSHETVECLTHKGWSVAPIIGTVCHGPRPLSNSSLPTPPDPLFPLCPNGPHPRH